MDFDVFFVGGGFVVVFLMFILFVGGGFVVC